jgi:transcriptional regulator with XRE-family HTH domain
MLRGQKIQRGEYEKKYGFELKVIRQRNDFNQKDIAKFLGVSVQQYQKYEAGMSKVCVGTENRIAEFFKMTRLELVEKIEELINQK